MTKKNSSTYACDYLRHNVTLSKLHALCDALEITYTPEDTKEQLCHKIKTKRPDLMRGRVWNMLRTIFRTMDLTSEGGLMFLKRFAAKVLQASVGIPPIDLYGLAEIATWLYGDPKYAVGYGRYALQREQARKILGVDPRKIPDGIFVGQKVKSSKKSSRSSKSKKSVKK
jgi:hypothetical protein